MRTRSSLLAAAAGLALAGSAMAQFAFPAFNPAPSGVTTTWRTQDLLTIATPTAGLYSGFQVQLDWVGGGINDQWSNEARVFFRSIGGTGTVATPTGPGTPFSVSAATPSNGANTGNNVSNLTFTGGFSTLYSGGNPLALNFRQSFNGTNANWSNVRVTLTSFVAPAAPSIDHDFGTLANSFPAAISSPSIALDGVNKKVAWFKFNAASALSAHDLFTQGSSILGGTTVGDTIMGLYDSNGFLLASNDDYSFPAAQWSRLGIGSGSGADPDGPGGLSAFGAGAIASLAAGDYYVGVAGWAPGFSFANAFVVNTANANAGNVQLNIIPAPGAAALLGLGGLLAARRRRN